MKLTSEQEKMLTAPPTEKDLRGYQRLLDDAASMSDPVILPNSGKEHAALMFSKMFTETKESLSMVVGNFCGMVSDNQKYLDSLKKFLCTKGVKCQILMLETPKFDSKALELLKEYQQASPENVKLRISSELTHDIAKTFFENGDKIVHWAVFDNDKFRLETSIETFSAIGGFHHPKYATLLQHAFNEVFASGKDYFA